MTRPITTRSWPHAHRDPPQSEARAAPSRACSARPTARTRARWCSAPGGLGLTTVNWDVDPRDYEAPGASAIREQVRETARPGSIVLLHDHRPELAGTAKALERIPSDPDDREL